MDTASIAKRSGAREPNLTDYVQARESFDWERAREELDGLPGGGLNMAHEAVERHARSELAYARALVCIGEGGRRTEWSYRELALATSRFANVLRGLGIAAGDRVFTLLGSVPELYVAVLGALKRRAIAGPLFAAFGPEPVATRLRLGGARVLVTSARLYTKRIAPLRSSLPALEHVLCVPDEGGAVPEGTLDLSVLLAGASDQYAIERTEPGEAALVHFTSGTTGTPKGAVHVHEAILAHRVTARLVLDLGPGDVFWCTADPGWVTGTSYGILGPLACGATVVAYDGPFDVERWYDLLERERVDVWYTAPTAIRRCMRAGVEAPSRRDLARLRLVASVGEPLNPEAVVWGSEALGLPIHDNWWQTETGGIMIANFRSVAIKPGSMGLPLPGIEAAIVVREGEGVRVIDKPDEVGELALVSGWPSMFRDYLGEPGRYAACFVGGYYLTGDLARRDADGYYWFVGRKDDIIKSAGHLIGPFEVESALMEHAAVAEAGVIGKPDPIAMEIVKAFVSLKPGFAPSEALAAEILGFARRRLGPVVAPRELAFEPNLPRTRSGKIMRRMLRARELGLPEGDRSTLEDTGTP
jgi:acetyl-CoA synthetase